MKKVLFCMFILMQLYDSTYAQDAAKQTSLLDFPSKYFTNTTFKTQALADRLQKQSDRLIRRLMRKERLCTKYLSNNTAQSNDIKNNRQSYKKLVGDSSPTDASLSNSSGEYLPGLDSLKASLTFLDKNRSLLDVNQREKLDKALLGVKNFESQLKQSEKIRQFIQQRQQQLSSLLSSYKKVPRRLLSQLKGYNKQVYYYSAQIQEYKSMFRDSRKLQQKALALLNRIPAFQKFMRENSGLNTLFSVPSSYSSTASVVGLQTRSQVQQIITTQLGGGANAGQIFGQQVQAGQAQLAKLKDKLDKLGSGASGDMAMPDFKPNSQRTKSLFDRLEWGTNLQSSRGNRFWPSTSDIGMSLGYRLNDKSIIGIGASYKVGWGQNSRQIKFSSEGMSLRSFADLQLKRSFYASAGFEYNYQPIANLDQFANKLNPWQSSGLVGISKIVSLKSKVFKKTKLQLLWDFLSYRQVPQAKALKFRVGYTF